MHVGAAELLGGDVLAGRRLHERRPADEDRAGAAHDDRLVAHRGHVGAAGGARAHDGGDLRDPLGRHARLVVEDPPEVLAVGEDVGLERQERAAGVDEVEAREVVLLGNLLRAQVLLDREREVGAALHGRVVRDDDALLALDDADPGDDPGRRRLRRRRHPTRRARSARGRRCPGRSAGRSARAPSACRASGGARAPARRRRAATRAVRSRSSATSASMRSARRAKVSSRSTCVVRSATK